MRSMKFLLFLLLLPSALIASDRPRLASTQTDNRCSISGTLRKGLKVLVEVEMANESKASMEEQARVDADSSWLKGRELTIWQSVQRVTIQLNGSPVLIAQSAFEDLYSVSSMSIEEKGGALHLTMSGGDAGGSYLATFKIVHSRRMKGRYQLTERVHRLGEFPDEVWEKTIYRNTIWDDPNM